MNSERLTRFVSIDTEIKDLEARVKMLKTERASLNDAILDDFAESNVESVTIDGKTVFTHRQIWAKSLFSKEAVASALRESGYGDLVTEGFNTNTLSAILREREERGDPVVPPELDGIIGFSEVYSVRARKR